MVIVPAFIRAAAICAAVAGVSMMGGYMLGKQDGAKQRAIDAAKAKAKTMERINDAGNDIDSADVDSVLRSIGK